MKNLVIIGAIAIFAVAFFLSDPFRDKVQSSYEGLTQWTPERIAEEPVLYMDHLERETKDAIEKLRVQKVGNTQQLERIKGKATEADAKLGAAQRALGGMKELFLAGVYPATWETLAFESEEQLRSGIISLAKDIENWQKKSTAYGNATSKLERNDGKINSSIQESEALLAGIETNREVLAVKEIGSDIDGTLSEMGASFAAVSAVAYQPETISVDDVSELTESAEDSALFDRIMAD